MRLHGATILDMHVVDHPNGFTDDLEAVDVERDGEQGVLARENHMACRRVQGIEAVIRDCDEVV